jgi:hypothetical protein
LQRSTSTGDPFDEALEDALASSGITLPDHLRGECKSVSRTHPLASQTKQQVQNPYPPVLCLPPNALAVAGDNYEDPNELEYENPDGSLPPKPGPYQNAPSEPGSELYEDPNGTVSRHQQRPARAAALRAPPAPSLAPPQQPNQRETAPMPSIPTMRTRMGRRSPRTRMSQPTPTPTAAHGPHPHPRQPPPPPTLGCVVAFGSGPGQTACVGGLGERKEENCVLTRRSRAAVAVGPTGFAAAWPPVWRGPWHNSSYSCGGRAAGLRRRHCLQSTQALVCPSLRAVGSCTRTRTWPTMTTMMPRARWRQWRRRLTRRSHGCHRGAQSRCWWSRTSHLCQCTTLASSFPASPRPSAHPSICAAEASPVALRG